MLALIFEHISGTNLRAHGRPVQEAAALLLAVLCQIVATRNRTARGWRGRAPLLIGFAGAIRPSQQGVAPLNGCCHPHRACVSCAAKSTMRGGGSRSAFLIQNAQNRDSAALQMKLDELIRVAAARERLVGIERLSESELETMREEIEKDGE